MPFAEVSPPRADQKNTEVPKRFRTARATLFADRFMTHFIKVGGLGVIAAVIGIFVFIFSQTIPLFQSAKVHPIRSIPLEPGDYRILGADEWGELPFLIDSKGVITFVDLKGDRGASRIDIAEQVGKQISAVHYNEDQGELICGTTDGFFFVVRIQYMPLFEENERRIQEKLLTGPLFEIGPSGAAVQEIAYSNPGEKKLAVAVQEIQGEKKVSAVSLAQSKTLFGAGETKVSGAYDLSPLLSGEPERILINWHADGIAVATEDGTVYYIVENQGEMVLRQVFKPFSDLEDASIASMNYALGSVSLVFTNPEGINRVFSLFVPRGKNLREFGHTKTFEPLPGPATFFNASLRNKAILLGNGSFASIRYLTTETIRWQKELPFEIKLGILGPKYDRIFFLDNEEHLHLYSLRDPHPESGIKSAFRKLWYEGYPAPSYEWQSTGSTDDFEPKMSLIPLIIGTFKGTVYALLFALPTALLAAIYVSQFGHPRFKFFVKPTMEIMASLPSVVLGFLAALWLAPIIETRVPSILLIFILVPHLAFWAGWGWTSLPIRYRKWIRPGYEWTALFPVLAFGLWAGWVLGPVLESVFFVVTDPATGAKIADFRLWWPQATGTSFTQRNSLVVGFMMGFAVIPIIFTIAEDSLSNVPRTLVSGSLALGASRWQTALRIVLPTAFPGIFSAMMIGLGRAVGETMIVVMATGNTPIMNFNIFSGMRTLSANIAVELPEAPYLGTLYRTLFLGAVVLFMMTFVVNTVAEIVRQRFREKYKAV